VIDISGRDSGFSRFKIYLFVGTSPPDKKAVLRHNSMRAENSALPCCDGCPIQVIRSPSSAKNLSRRNARGVFLYIKDGRNPYVFATLRWFGLGGLIVPVVQPS